MLGLKTHPSHMDTLPLLNLTSSLQTSLPPYGRKQYNYFLNSTNHAEIQNTLPSHVPSSETSNNEEAIAQNPKASAFVLQIKNPSVCINDFACPLELMQNEVSTLLLPHVEIAPRTDPTHSFF